jgi:hypothetical protein
MTNELQDQNTADQEQAAAAETHEAPEADAAVAEGEDTGEAANPDQQDDAPESARKNKGVGKRINELTREKHEAKRREEAAQREAEYWKKVALEKGGDREEPAKPAAAPEAGAKPRAEDFENYADFIEALTDWKTEERERQRANAARVQAAQQEQRRTQESLAQKIESARERFEDFDDVVGNPDLPITDHMAQAIALSDVGADVAYHLGKNPKEAARIASLHPAAQAVEIGKLGVELGLRAKQKTVSKAPPPVQSRVTGSSGVQKDPDQMTTAEWMAWRNANP